MRLGLRFAATLAILLVIQFARTLVTPLPSIPDVSHLPTPFLTVVIPTVPRRDNSMFIINTIQSFLDQWPVSDADPYFDRLSIVVINHRPEEHAAFDAARLGIMATPLGQHYVTFIEREDEAGIVPLLQRQLVHVRGALSAAFQRVSNSTYYLLVEDDFPLCPDSWPLLLRYISKAHNEIPDLCGLFAATGGSGFVLTQRGLTAVLRRLEEAIKLGEESPHDVMMQHCLRGDSGAHLVSECSGCLNSLAVTPALLFRHIGISSTLRASTYDRYKWQCGWRHPFAEDNDVKRIFI